MVIKNIIFIKDIEEIFNNYYNNVKTNKDYYYKDDIKNNIYQEINNKTLLYLIENIEIAENIINLELEKKFIIENYDWKICLTKENFMFNNPFTLEDVIFMPQKYIIDNINKKERINFIITLVHEYIHISQRYRGNIWNKYILDNTNWILLDIKINDDKINDNYILNPDTYYLNKSFLYKINNKLYYGRFEFDKKLKIHWYEFINNQYIKIDKFINKYEHPYEEMAYTLTEKLKKYFK
jgi:hypothetical protein